MSDEIVSGETFSVDKYPFVLEEYSEYSDGGPVTVKSWKPGVRYELVDYDGSGAPFYDGLGKQHLTVVSVHKPGKFPTRVFYTRQWEDPDGKRFGKTSLRICVVPKFKRLIAGFGVGVDEFQYNPPRPSKVRGKP